MQKPAMQLSRVNLMSSPRIAARAVILQNDRLLLVNAYADATSTLWCAPGGGIERGQSIPDNLAREVHEETGLIVSVGPPCLINEFHAPESGFHQIEIFFRCKVLTGTLSDDWQDPENIVDRRRWVTRAEMENMRFKPDSLPEVAWRDRAFSYDPLETLVPPT